MPGDLDDGLLTDSEERRPLAELFRDLRSSSDGLSSRDAARRLVVSGPNELTRRHGRNWPRELAAQFTQPLAVLLEIATVLAWFGGTPALAVAVAVVILLNAAFAFVQEMQAERAVEALAAFLPSNATVVRDGITVDIPARDLVPGDVLLVHEGERVCADARIISGTVLIDLSALTGESMPAARSANVGPITGSLLEASDLVFSGTTCTGGEARTLVSRTGMHTELGRIAALSQRGKPERSPLEQQVRRATLILAAVAIVVGAAFLPAGLIAGLSLSAALSFAIGLIVANVPEGLLPTITLALAVGVRELATRGAVMKRLSSVETLGSTTVICTDKTGTLTQNRMQVTRLWLPTAELDSAGARGNPAAGALALTAATCTTAEPPTADQTGRGDPTELALLQLAEDLGVGRSVHERETARRGIFSFDAHLQRMSSIDAGLSGPGPSGSVVINVKGAIESVLPCCRSILDDAGTARALDDAAKVSVGRAVDDYAQRGLRVLAIARRELAPGETLPSEREDAERDLSLVGLVAMVDPPRAGVAEAVGLAHDAGVRINVITGDYGLTAAEIARQVGIGADGIRIVSGDDLDAMSEPDLDAFLAAPGEIVFARTSPEGKLRICEALRDLHEVVAMTGDGVNDAPALRHADIGIAMGQSGTDVAREAATMVLTDDNFATIVAAIDAGRRVFDNVRKFILYIFAHAVPEVVPFLVFALSGGAIPLPLTVLQILAIDLGTETLPALALGREPAEPGLMSRPPRPRSVGVIDRRLLLRAWGVLGAISAALVLAGFWVTLSRAGWHPGDPTGSGSPLHHAYLQATTMTFAGIVACQLGTGFAARSDRASLLQIGVLSNPLLLGGMAFEVAFTACVIYLPLLQPVFHTAALGWADLAILAPFPFVVWGVDELYRWSLRRRDRLIAAS